MIQDGERDNGEDNHQRDMIYCIALDLPFLTLQTSMISLERREGFVIQNIVVRWGDVHIVEIARSNL